MREDTNAALARIDRHSRGLGTKQTALIEDLESRLSPERKVRVAIYTIGHGGPGIGSDSGALLITDYGVHWKGESDGAARVDIPWDKIHRQDVAEESVGGWRKKKRDYDLIIESSNPDHRLRFRLYQDDQLADAVREALASSQPLL